MSYAAQYLESEMAARELEVSVLVNCLVQDAIRLGASDLHIEPWEAAIAVRARVNGVLVEVVHLPLDLLDRGRFRRALLPILVLASMNAFGEELLYRASLIATLEDVAGPVHAVALAAVVFGLGHFYGVPYGVAGVLMSGFLGWLLGKSMVETRGFFWAWFIHCLQDVLIFSFMAMSLVTPGG